MSKADLKAAMESLNVKKPLRLHAPSPAFKAPSPPMITEPTQVDNTPPVTDSIPVQIQTEVGKVAEVQNETPVSNPIPAPVVTATQAEAYTQTPVESKTLVDSVSSVTIPTSVTDTTQVVNQTDAEVLNSTQAAEITPVPELTSVERVYRASDQDSSVAMEAQATPKLHNGYTRLPNTILMRMVSGDLSRNEMKLILLIARFTISYQRRHAPLSKTVIERQAGIRGPAVLQAVSDLLAKGLIDKITGDQHRPNQLGLVFADDWDFLSKESTATSVQNQPQVASQTQAQLSTSAPVAKTTSAGVVNTTDFKHTETNKKKISLSFECVDDFLKKYFYELKPAKKRESEWEAFSGLKQDFSEGEIAHALQFLFENGTPGNGKPCHSPMAYLSMAMGEVIAVLRTQKERENRLAQTLSNLDVQAQIAESKAVEEEKDLRARGEAFRIAFPTEREQLEVISQFAGRFPMLDPKGSVIRNLAMEAWWSERSEKAKENGGMEEYSNSPK